MRGKVLFAVLIGACAVIASADSPAQDAKGKADGQAKKAEANKVVKLAVTPIKEKNGYVVDGVGQFNHTRGLGGLAYATKKGDEVRVMMGVYHSQATVWVPVLEKGVVLKGVYVAPSTATDSAAPNLDKWVEAKEFASEVPRSYMPRVTTKAYAAAENLNSKHFMLFVLTKAAVVEGEKDPAAKKAGVVQPVPVQK